MAFTILQKNEESLPKKAKRAAFSVLEKIAIPFQFEEKQIVKHLQAPIISRLPFIPQEKREEIARAESGAEIATALIPPKLEKRGFTLLQEREPGEESLKRRLARFATALPLSLAVPSTFIGIGPLTKAGKLAKFVKGEKEIAALEKMGKPIELAETLAKQSKAGQRALVTFAGKRFIPKPVETAAFSVLETAQDAAKRLVGIKKGVPEVKTKIRELKEGIQFERGKAVEEGKRMFKAVPQEERKAITAILETATPPQGASPIGRLTELGGRKERMSHLAESLTPQGKEALEFLRGQRKEMETALTSRGILPESRLLPDYVRHTKEQKPVADFFRGLVSKAKPGFLKKRELKKPIDVLENEYGKEIFQSDIAIIHAIDKAEKSAAITTSDFFDEIAQNPAWVKPTTKEIRTVGAKKIEYEIVDPGFRLMEDAVPGWLKPKFRGVQISEEVAGDIVKAIPRMSNIDEVSKGLLKAFDASQNWWKAWTLSVFPSYHSRNVIGNFWNNYIAGVNPFAYETAGEIMLKRQGKVISNQGKEYTFDQVRELAKRSGVDDIGFYGGDIPSQIQRQVEGGKWTTLGRNNILVHKGMAIGKTLENHARMANFVDGLKMGLTPSDAALRVKKYLFDYSDLAPFERNVLKRIFPFYTWSRNNVPLQIENLITQPRKFGVIPKGIAAIEAGQEIPNEDLLADWIKQNTRIRLRKTNEGYEYFVLGGWLPAADINKLADPLKAMGELVTPFIKEPIEEITNYSFFLRRKLERAPGERGVFRTPLGKIDLPIRLQAFVKTANMPEKFLPSINLLRNIRILNEYDRVSASFDKTGPQLRGELQKQTPKQAIAQYLTGIRTTTLKPEMAKKFSAIEQTSFEKDYRGAIIRNFIKGNKKEAQRLIKELQERRKEFVEKISPK